MSADGPEATIPDAITLPAVRPRRALDLLRWSNVGVIVLLGGIGIASLAFIAVHVARNSHVSQQGDHVKVETPFGNVESSRDPEKAVQDLGVEIP